MRPSAREFAWAYWLPAAVWLSLVFFFSTDYFSSGQTSRFLLPLLRSLFFWLSAEQLDTVHFAIRKLGHVSEYFVLTILTFRCIRVTTREAPRAVAVCFLFVLLAAGVDEFHQSLTLSRGASPVDVGYDGFGGVLALWIAAVLGK